MKPTRAEAERLRSMSTVEMMGENLNVKHHVEEWEARCLKAEAEAERLRGERDEAIRVSDATAKERDEMEGELARLRTAPPAVQVTDCEKAADEIDKWVDEAMQSAQAHVAEVHRFHIRSAPVVLAILRKHTRAASVEEAAKAIRLDVSEGPYDALTQAHAALRALGVREAEPFVVDRAPLRAALIKAWHSGGGTFDAFDAETDAAIAEFARQQAEWQKGGAASLDERLKTPIQITKPGQSAEDFVREQREGEEPPAPASAGWTEEQRIEAVAVGWQMRDIFEEWRETMEYDVEMGIADRACAALARVAPHFHKVRVRLPRSRGNCAASEYGDVRYDNGWDGCLDRVAAALRAQGVLIEGEQ